MKKTLFFIMPLILLLSGCATYRLEKGQSPYEQGYVMARYGKAIPEYTIGQNNTVPDEQVAKERFRRRKAQVEHYYKQMGYIENRFKQMFVDPPVLMLEAIIGIFRMPAIAIRDYKYNHNIQYKETVDKREDAQYQADKERIAVLKGKLDAYIQKDLQREPVVLTQSPAVIKEIPPVAAEVKEPIKEEPLAQGQKAAVEETAMPKIQEEPVQKVLPLPEPKVKKIITTVQAKPNNPSAVIIAKPTKGASPLKVQFYASKSSSPNGRIVAYSWDFGDGDTSTKKNPTNTYWSTSYGLRQFTATLLVQDEKGLTSSASVIIEVTTK